MGFIANTYDKIARRFKNSAYTAAGLGGRTKSWYAPALSPHTALTSDLSKLINRSRAAIRNDPWASSGLEKLVSNVIGRGITPKSLVSDDSLREELQTLFLQWSDESDADFRTLNSLAYLQGISRCSSFTFMAFAQSVSLFLLEER